VQKTKWEDNLWKERTLFPLTINSPTDQLPFIDKENPCALACVPQY